ncbi:uncharacterized protein LOC119607251 [Lucilia sericata]|uniref:uncharacterized protein LOC119607251 n=1 Tax=Lucilia sericata TaxID=13632 RepID=UPI0018A804BB|nr:uncharacterized protein LOC119607251 [Lucilia sericata]
MFAAKMEKISTEKENLQCCLVKFKFAVCKIFKQILNKDSKLTENNNNITANNFPDNENNKCSCDNEIEQNQANERLLKASQQKHQQHQPYVLTIETAVGSFYWDWECGMQRDSFADFNFNTH